MPPTTERVGPNGIKVPCHLCNGEGGRWVSYDPSDREDFDSCDRCWGSGFEMELPPCSTCKGRGYERQESVRGFFEEYPCGSCHGDGYDMTRADTFRYSSSIPRTRCMVCAEDIGRLSRELCDRCVFRQDQIQESLKKIKQTPTDPGTTCEQQVTATYERQVVARHETVVKIDVRVEDRFYDGEDHLVFETSISGGDNHPWPRDCLRISVPKGTRLAGDGAYSLTVPSKVEKVVERQEVVREIDTTRVGMAFLIGFYSLLRWVLWATRPVPTDDASIRFSLLELN